MTPTSADAWAVADPTLCPVCGRESCEDHLPADAPTTLGPVSSLKLRAVRALDLIDLPAPVAIVEDIASAGAVTVLAGESGTGKTFVLDDLSGAVGDGDAWHGRATLAGSVVLMAFEGDALGLRFRALRDHVGRRLDHVYVLRGSDPLSPIVTRDGETCSRGELSAADALDALAVELAAANRPPVVLLIVDTVRASMTGSEDSSESVAAYLRVIRRLLARLPGAAAILAHHAGWQDGETQRKRERGSSAWRGNVDYTLYLEAGEYDPDRGEAYLTLRTLKTRDGERPPDLALIRRRVELAGQDRHGRPVTSCVIARDWRTREDRAAARADTVAAEDRLTDRRVLQAMRDYPTATSISRLRPYIGLQTAAVSDAVARILRAGWATEGRRGQPYTVTDVGIATLNGSGQ